MPQSLCQLLLLFKGLKLSTKRIERSLQRDDLLKLTLALRTYFFDSLPLLNLLALLAVFAKGDREISNSLDPLESLDPSPCNKVLLLAAALEVYRS